MSGTWRQDELRGTIPFEEIELIEIVDFESNDLLEALPDEPAIMLELTVARVPHPLRQEVPTVAQAGWELTPPLGSLQSRANRRPVHDEVTAVRPAPQGQEQHWVDLHAIVDGEGRLELPARISTKLPAGAVIEIRVASWALPDQ